MDLHARKLLFDDDYLKGRCAVGKKGTTNEAMNKEQLGIMKGKSYTLVFMEVQNLFCYDRVPTRAAPRQQSFKQRVQWDSEQRLLWGEEEDDEELYLGQ